MDSLIPTGTWIILFLFGGVLLFVKIVEWMDRRKEKVEGFRFEYLCSGLVRATEGEWALIYHQDGLQVCFLGSSEGNKMKSVSLESAYGDTEAMCLYENSRDLIHARVRNELQTGRKGIGIDE